MVYSDSYSLRRIKLIVPFCAVTSAVLGVSSYAHGQTIFQSVEEVIYVAETYPHLAFQKLGFDDASDVSRENTQGEVLADRITASADFTFVLDGEAFFGPGSWLSIETSSSLEIYLDFELSSGGDTLVYSYTWDGDLIGATSTETVTASLTSSVRETSTFSVVKTTSVTSTPTSETETISATVDINGAVTDSTVTVIETLVSSTESQFSVTYVDTPVEGGAQNAMVEAEYDMVTHPDESMTATFTRYDVTFDGELTYTLGPTPSVHQFDHVSDDLVLQTLTMDLVGVGGRAGPISYTVTGFTQLTRSLIGRNDDGWSWSDFGKATASGAGAGLVAGAGASLLTDSAAPVAVGPAAGIGAATGAAAGAVGYCVGKLWDSIFGKGLALDATCSTGTFAEGLLTCDQDATGAVGYPGACCDAEGNCSQKTLLTCEYDGGVFMGEGVSCTPNPCVDGACCTVPTGECNVVASPDACPAPDYLWLGWGTDCDPNCCSQPLPWPGRDDCDAATAAMPAAHTIIVPDYQLCPPACPAPYVCNENGVCAFELTVTGDTLTATEGMCNQSCGDQGWYEAFDFQDGVGQPAQCVRLTTDECCTEPNHPTSYTYIIQGCSEAAMDCGNIVAADEYNWGPPVCDPGDGSMWCVFEAMPGGLYHYPVPVFNEAGYRHPYQLHITVEGCYEKPCCYLPNFPDCDGGPLCIETNEIDCEERDGWLRDDADLCINVDCTLGACCGDLIQFDCDDNSGAGITCPDCFALSGAGLWYGGARCPPIDDPCPVCPFWDDPHCMYDEQGDYFLYVDRSGGDPYPRVADDFVAHATGPVTQICWAPCFYDPTNNEECYDPEEGNPPAPIDDMFQVVWYEDDNGLPGTVIAGPEILTIAASKWRGGNSRCWEYTALLVDQPSLTVCHTYWIEITGSGVEDGCAVYWLTNGEGNHYCLQDRNGVWGPEDVVFLAGAGNAAAAYSEMIDMTYCLDTGIDTPAEVVGACVECGEEGATCRDNGGAMVTHDDCRGSWTPIATPPDGADGIQFHPDKTCGEVTLPEYPENDDCDGGSPIVLSGTGNTCETLPDTYCEDHPATSCDTDQDCVDAGHSGPCVGSCGPIEFKNLCTSNDGPSQECGTQFAADIWFEYHTAADEWGYFRVSACTDDGGNGDYDGILAVYRNGTDICTCDFEADMQMYRCGDDTCGQGGGMPVVPDPGADPPGNLMPFFPNQCYLIRMGGWAGEMGSGSFMIDIVSRFEYVVTEVKRPMGEDCATIGSKGTKCNTTGECDSDADCWEESHCVPAPIEDQPAPGRCYAPKLRFLSIAAHPEQAPHTARRVKLMDHPPGDPNGTVLGWVGAPEEVNPLQEPGTIWIAEVQADPYYTDAWPDVLHVTCCKIAHAALCHPGHCAGDTEVPCETDAECTVVGGPCCWYHCDPNSCPTVPFPTTCVYHWYNIQAIAFGDDIGNEGNYSECLPLRTNTTWGNTVSTITADNGRPPDGSVGLEDVMAAIKKYQITNVAPITWIDIAPSTGNQCPDQSIGIDDIMDVIAGYGGAGYPGNGPLNCYETCP